MAENQHLRRVWLALAPTSKLWRLNSGKAWVSDGGKPIPQQNGAILLPAPAHPIALGFSMTNGKPVAGAGDLIGYTKVLITADMVGKTLPVFTTVDAKTDKGRISDDQDSFAHTIADAGGVAGFAWDEESAVEIINRYHRHR